MGTEQTEGQLAKSEVELQSGEKETHTRHNLSTITRVERVGHAKRFSVWPYAVEHRNTHNVLYILVAGTLVLSHVGVPNNLPEMTIDILKIP